MKRLDLIIRKNTVSKKRRVALRFYKKTFCDTPFWRLGLIREKRCQGSGINYFIAWIGCQQPRPPDRSWCD